MCWWASAAAEAVGDGCTRLKHRGELGFPLGRLLGSPVREAGIDCAQPSACNFPISQTRLRAKQGMGGRDEGRDEGREREKEV